MAFPQTHVTLIERLAGGGDNTDWAEFLQDYWEPVCRFARQRGNLSREDAEDVASETLEAIVRNKLLTRWSADRSAKLRTLICTVVLNILSNRGRVASGRKRAVSDHAGELDRYLDLTPGSSESASAESVDSFYSAWAEEVLDRAIDGVMTSYNESGKGDHVRVLYDRVCKGKAFQEIADALKLTPGTADGYFRQALQRVSDRLQDLVRWQVGRYSSAGEVDSEFVVEWGRLADHLHQHGGLEAAVGRSCRVVSA